MYRSQGTQPQLAGGPPSPHAVSRYLEGEGLQGHRQVLGSSCLSSPEAKVFGSVTLPFPAQEPGLLSPLPGSAWIQKAEAS